MKILKRSLYALAAVALMTACSDDKIGGEEPNTPNHPGTEESEGVYVSLEVKMPTEGRRSQTDSNGDSTDGTEVGSDAENTVSSLLIVLTDINNNIITAGSVLSNNLQATSANTYKAVAKFQKTQIAGYYQDENSNDIDLTPTQAKVNVYVFCNPTQDLTSTIIASADSDSNDWINTVCTVDAAKNGGINTGIWAPNGFLMNNSKIAQRSFPLHLEDWDSYKTSSSPFHLSEDNGAGTNHQVDNSIGGPVEVERSVARFDFKDGSDNTTAANTYGVLYGNYYDEDGTIDFTKEGPLFVNVELQRICLTNMAKDFYYVPRVSATGGPTNAIICGRETPTNYVVSPNYTKFSAQSAAGLTAAGVFNFPFFNAQGEIDNISADDNVEGGDRWSSYYINDVLNGTSDNYGDKSYHVWRYCTENTIPGPVEKETYGRSTIIVFKGKLIATEAALSADTLKYAGIQQVARALTDATGDPTKDPILYYHAGTLYATWEMVRNAVRMEAVEITTNGQVNVNRNNSLYIACYGTGGMLPFEYEYTIINADGEEETVKAEFEDNKPLDPNSANAAWTAWDAAGKPNDNAAGSLLSKMRQAMTSEQAQFTLYQSSIDNRFGPGYYVYYYYRNRHNDNTDNGVMGPMEFAVVRNNVYKLSVTNINRLGHPRLSVNDPEPPTPDTPDESDNVYIDVECQVLPWSVRINNIEF